MRNIKCYISIIFLVLGTQLVLFAQTLPVVAAYALVSNEVSDPVSKTVNDLVFSFIKELRTYRPLDMRADQLPRDLGVPDGADYIFYGNLINQSDGIKLELVLKGGPQRITRLISRVYDNSNRILLESRLLVRDLFDQSVSLPDPVETAQTQPLPEQAGTDPAPKMPIGNKELVPVENMDSLAGSWRGEDGIEKVMLLRGGRGVAVLTSGISLTLELLVTGGELVIRQKGTANPRQFIDLPDPVAKQAAAIAPPLEWRFLISADQTVLSGTKKTVLIKNDGKNILTMEDRTLNVNWIRN